MGSKGRCYRYGVSDRRARWLLWTAGVLLAPLPYGMVVEGRVPVARFAWLAGVSAAYATGVDGSGVAWVMTAVLAGHALVWGALLWGVAFALARGLPAAARRLAVWGIIAVAGTAALVLEPYRTPFDAEALRAGWLGLFP